MGVYLSVTNVLLQTVSQDFAALTIPFRLPERAALDVHDRTALQRHEQRERALRLIQLFDHELRGFDLLVFGQAHQREFRVVVIHGAISKDFRYFVFRPEHHKVQTSGHNHLRNAHLCRRIETGFAAIVKTPGDKPRDFAQGVIQHSGEIALRDQFFHRGTAYTVGMKDHEVDAAFLYLGTNVHQRAGGVAEHGSGDCFAFRGVAGSIRISLRHACNRGGGIVEYGAAHRIQAENIHHRMHHHNVSRADEGRELAMPRRQRRDDQLGEADGQRLHCRGSKHRPFRAAQRCRPVYAPLSEQIQCDFADAFQHFLDGFTARACVAQRLDVRACRFRNHRAVEIRRDAYRLAQNP